MSVGSGRRQFIKVEESLLAGTWYLTRQLLRSYMDVGRERGMVSENGYFTCEGGGSSDACERCVRTG